jgi:hypothetical protein
LSYVGLAQCIPRSFHAKTTYFVLFIADDLIRAVGIDREGNEGDPKTVVGDDPDDVEADEEVPEETVVAVCPDVEDDPVEDAAVSEDKVSDVVDPDKDDVAAKVVPDRVVVLCDEVPGFWLPAIQPAKIKMTVIIKRTNRMCLCNKITSLNIIILF